MEVFCRFATPFNTFFSLAERKRNRRIRICFLLAYQVATECLRKTSSVLFQLCGTKCLNVRHCCKIASKMNYKRETIPEVSEEEIFVARAVFAAIPASIPSFALSRPLFSDSIVRHCARSFGKVWANRDEGPKLYENPEDKPMPKHKKKKSNRKKNKKQSDGLISVKESSNDDSSVVVTTSPSGTEASSSLSSPLFTTQPRKFLFI